MIIVGSNVSICDNSGITLVKCIKISNSKKKVATALMNIVAWFKNLVLPRSFEKGLL